jgi:Uma2 family endonuclease
MAVGVTTTASVSEPTPHRFTTADYYKMGPDHADVVDDALDVYKSAYKGRAFVRSQLPIHLLDGSEPEPDVALARTHPGVRRPYRGAHPTAADTLLVIEVADSTLAFDLGPKALMYARHNIQDMWVLDIRGDRLVVHREPSPEGYRSVTERRRGDSITALAFPDVTLTLDEILGEP